ncbi:MAG: hypothetical protein IJM56_06710, partial [Clostridia bacterium]|nr:hypothetical protein [Clostridia bacterium]
ESQHKRQELSHLTTSKLNSFIAAQRKKRFPNIGLFPLCAEDERYYSVFAHKMQTISPVLNKYNIK